MDGTTEATRNRLSVYPTRETSALHREMRSLEISDDLPPDSHRMQRTRVSFFFFFFTQAREERHVFQRVIRVRRRY